MRAFDNAFYFMLKGQMVLGKNQHKHAELGMPTIAKGRSYKLAGSIKF